MTPITNNSELLRWGDKMSNRLKTDAVAGLAGVKEKYQEDLSENMEADADFPRFQATANQQFFAVVGDKITNSAYKATESIHRQAFLTDDTGEW